MKKQRLPAIEYIRGISMLGVIGIHTGSQYLTNQFSNIHLVALFEVFTRFSVPIFFFVSAFGLFYNLDLSQKFSYKNFMSRRFKTVLIPYLSWSFIYLIYYILAYRDYSFWNIPAMLKCLFFGLASYQLYFLVILLWFYVLMPTWIYLTKHMTMEKLGLLLVLQLIFDYYSSYVLTADTNSKLLNLFIQYRLNYLVLHYIFIFTLGAYCAIHYEKFYVLLKKYYTQIKISFITTLAALLGYYYYLIYVKQYSAEAAINTAHQLCPAGIFYTIAACLFFFALFSFTKISTSGHKLLTLLGKHSYFAYLAHPFAIHYLFIFVGFTGHLMTAPITVLYYFAVAILSVTVAVWMRKLGDKIPLINILLIGVYPKQKNIKK